ncbi:MULTISPECIES: LexA family protein [Bacillus]|uniref:LexA family protein n=1 Tax=Bacillus TaxID=1386 RepID=UPI00227E54D0|nr:MULTISPECIES: XRE family transcriptional regulator [Bacillus]MCY7565664.1 XRE family transcriptional regulator [Bacillus safensis]MCY7626471.1 XRE family transcriptional regulator [Bacillus safensis]MCY7632665.1 XRE family transcriptional regulator [Bacillus safensis]MCY7649981.1 XRE family transcriptional regulator [Bacillus safensis]MCY7651569.1 XRE family transcriptional regulator [Bacillus safensis]
MTVGERIRSRRKQLGMTVDQLADRLGKNRATVYRYESNEIDNMPLTVLEPLAKALNVTPAYLMGWESAEPIQLSTEYPYYPIGISAGLPLGIDSIDENNVEYISIPDNLMGKWAGRKDIFMMRINGDSMNRIMPHDSLIAVRPVPLSNLRDGDIVVYSDGGDYAVKRFYRREDKVIFRPDSSDLSFTDYVTSADNSDLRIHGKVVLYIAELD